MLKLIITKFWPVLIPLIIYLIFKFFILPNIKDNKDKRKAQALYIYIIATIFSLILSIIIFFINDSAVKTRYYEPAKIINNKIQPAIIE